MIEILLFASGAALMVLELTASRILSPYLGSSIFVWTAVIGIIMAALSAGYYWGGKIADKKLNISLLSNIVFVTSLSILACFLTREFVLMNVSGWIRDPRLSSAATAALLFALPSFLFGTITPYATRLKLKKIENSGEVVGKLYAISTLGSIVGTFLTGYVLLGYFGSKTILLILAAIMLMLSISLDYKNFFKIRKILALLFFCVLAVSAIKGAKEGSLYETESNYQKIIVYDSRRRDNGRPVRLLRTSILSQSGRYLDGDDLLFEYIGQLTLVTHFAPDAANYLFIGGGGYSLPTYLSNTNPSLEADVVEIDPKVSEVAFKYFKASGKLNTYNQDGRSFINNASKKYDVIVLDAYRDELIMPFELTTSEAVQRYFDLLNDDGILAINIISALEGPKSQFLRSEIKTLKKIFPEVLLFQAVSDSEAQFLQNIEVFAFKEGSDPNLVSKDGHYQKLLDNRWEGNLDTDAVVLTDDFAPIERYMLAGF